MWKNQKNKIVFLLFILFNCFCSSIFSQKQKSILNVIAPTQSGLFFKNTIIETEEKNIFINGMPYLYAGGGIATGDINNDGLIDIFFVGNEVPSKLFINKGNLQFEDRTESYGIHTHAWCTGAYMCDVNGDGWLDIYILKAQNTDSTTGGNLLYINKQGSHFVESSKEFGLDINSQSLSASFFDMDNDGDMDLYVAIYPNISIIGDDISWDFNKKFKPTYGGDLLFENINNSTFKNISTSAGILNENGFGISVKTADINQDGFIDIYVGNDFAEPDYLYLNNGNKTFTESIKSKLAHTSFFTMGVDCKDINNDLLPDILTLDMNPENIVKYKTDFNTFDYELYNKTKLHYYNQEIRNTLQIQNTFGTFSDIAQIDKIAFTDWSWSPLIVDLDNDGLQDIFITNGLKKNILNQNMFLFEIDSILRSQDNSTSSLSNMQKLSYIPAMKEQNYFFKNNGDCHFSNESNTWTNADVSISTGAAYADFDNDGDIDIITNEIDTFPILYKNTTIDSTINDYIGFDITYKNHIANGAKVFLYSHNKIVYQEVNNSCGIMSNSTNYIHFGCTKNDIIDSVLIFYNDSNYAYKLTLPAIHQYHHINLTNLSKSKYSLANIVSYTAPWKLNEVVANTAKSSKDDFKFQSLLFQKYSKTNPTSYIFDLNMDGLDDIIYGAFENTPTQFFFQNKDLSFTLQSNLTIPNPTKKTVSDILIADINEDGINELYLSYTNFYFSSNDSSTSNFLEAYTISNNANSYSLSAVKNLPIIHTPISILRSSSSNTLYLIGSITLNTFPNENYSYVIYYENNKFIIDTIKAIGFDLNKNLTKDLAIQFNKNNGIASFLFANHYAPVYRINVNTNQNKYDLQKITQNGLWNKCKIIDLNQDGLDDYVLLNFGLNTRYNLKAENKLTLVTKDFDNNNQRDPVSCVEINNDIFPMYTFNFFTSYFPYSRKKVYNYNAYATMPLRGIYDTTNSDLRYVDNLESQIVLNNLTKILLPSSLQWTSLNDIYIDTLHKVMYFAGNSNTTRSDIGYNDAAALIILPYELINHEISFKKPIINNLPNTFIQKIDKIKCNDAYYLLLNTNIGIYLTNIKVN
ncbi:MAG: VCBS repeat-containing protein [Bacteroidota bacterium]